MARGQAARCSAHADLCQPSRREPVCRRDGEVVLLECSEELPPGLFRVVDRQNVVPQSCRVDARKIRFFHREDAGVFSQISLRTRAVDADRVTPTGTEQAHLSNGGFPWMYRRGTFDDTPIPCPEPDTALGFGVGTLLVSRLSRRRRAH